MDANNQEQLLGDTSGSALPPAPPMLDVDTSAGSALPPVPPVPSVVRRGSDKSVVSSDCSDAKDAHNSSVVFVIPDEGTPAAAALAANANLNVTKTDKFMRKIRGIKHPKLKTFNVIKQLKKHTKVRRKAHKNFKGKVIDGEHELYVITAGIMLGINCSVGHLQMLGHEVHEEDDDHDVLCLDDFNFVEKANFPASGSDELPYPTPPHSLRHTFKFKTYAPKVFARLRDLCDINVNDYMESICGNYNFLEFLSNSKSGMFFFYSHDGKYMLKTQTKEENRFMKCILPHYYKYLAENPHSTLVRILGMHRVKMYQFRRKLHFVIMTSVFDTPEQIHTIYDLKGSTIGRSATEREKASGGVLKDLDLLEDDRKFHLGNKKKAFLDQLEKDAKFLATLGIMDYSLLLGVHHRDRRVPINDSNTKAINDSSALKGNIGNNHTHSDTPLRRAAHQGQGLPADIAANTGKSELLLQGKVSESIIDEVGGEEEGIEGEIIDDDEDENNSRDNTSVVPSSDDESCVDSDDNVSIGETFVQPTDNLGNIGSSEVLLQGETSYSDTNGLSSPEGLRLSHILSVRNIPSPVNSPEGSPSKGVNQEEDTGDISSQRKRRESVNAIQGKHPWTQRKDGGINSRSSEDERGNEIYYCGVIDILQKYNARKQSESLLKGLYLDTDKISAVNPDRYADRFIKFFQDNID